MEERWQKSSRNRAAARDFQQRRQPNCERKDQAALCLGVVRTCPSYPDIVSPYAAWVCGCCPGVRPFWRYFLCFPLLRRPERLPGHTDQSEATEDPKEKVGWGDCRLHSTEYGYEYNGICCR